MCYATQNLFTYFEEFFTGNIFKRLSFFFLNFFLNPVDVFRYSCINGGNIFTGTSLSIWDCTNKVEWEFSIRSYREHKWASGITCACFNLMKEKQRNNNICLNFESNLISIHLWSLPYILQKVSVYWSMHCKKWMKTILTAFTAINSCTYDNITELSISCVVTDFPVQTLTLFIINHWNLQLHQNGWCFQTIFLF